MLSPSIVCISYLVVLGIVLIYEDNISLPLILALCDIIVTFATI
nr:MAG TPA: hypothetical protein [Caudoviricetes sp.]